MVSSEEHTKMNQDHHKLQDTSIKKKGGFVTLPFIIANESFEKLASVGLMPNMIIYLTVEYKMSVRTAQNLVFCWTSALSIFPIIGAFVADSLAGRFLTIAIGSITSLLGMFTLWMTTMIPQAKLPLCNNPLASKCESPTIWHYVLLITACTIMSIGTGGVRPCSQAFGADQIDQRHNPKNTRVLETFFSWYYACGCLSIVVALTVIVYIQEHFGWKIGFGIPVIMMLFSAVSFLLASPYYLRIEVERNLFSSLAQVVVAAFKNRKTSYLAQGSIMERYYQRKGCVASIPSTTLRFLNKACIIGNVDQDIGLDGMAVNPWRLATVQDVEGLKSLLRVLPIWSASIMMSVNIAVGSFPVLLALTMDRHLSPHFQVPAASFGTMLVIVIVIWIPIYDRLLIPLASKICKRPVHFNVKLRMGIGLFFSFMSMVSAAIVEGIRRRKAISEGFENSPLGVVHMTAMWTVPQYVFGGLAEAFNGIGQNEFYYTELPKDMSSIATSLSGLGMAFGSMTAGTVLNVVAAMTRKDGSEGWIANNVNKGRYDYYYWVLAGLSFLNMIYYMYCSWVYGAVVEQRGKEVSEDELVMLGNTSRREFVE